MPFLRDFQISIRTGLGVGVVAALVLTAAIVHVPWSLTSRANILSLNERLNEKVIQGVGDKVDSLLGNAVSLRDMVATAVSLGMVTHGEPERRESLLISMLINQPGVTSIELATPDNYSLLVRRDTQNTVVAEETVPGAPTDKRRVRVHRDFGDGNLIRESQTETATDYRATEQFWYFSAFDKDQPVWSNIYPLPVLGVLGVTTAKAIQRDGELLGVVGVTITLGQLSRFLEGIEISPNGAVFLAHIYNELVAIQKNMGEGPSSADRGGKIARLDQSGLPAARVLREALKENRVDIAGLEMLRQLTFRDPADGAVYFVTLAPLVQMGLIATVVIPEDDIFGAINRNLRNLLIGLAFFILATVAIMTLLARGTIATPLRRVTEALGELEDFRFDRVSPIPSRFSELRQVSAAIQRMSTSLASFKKYIPTELVRSLFAEGIEAELGGERRELTILFMDLADFTRISERLGDAVIGFLGDYLGEMSDEIQGHSGTIDKYIGDAVMAFWGAPARNERHAVLACRAALGCQARLARLRQENRAKDLPALRARIGINTGRVLVGNVGSRDRLIYTVIGDPVNVASRLEALNKVYGTEIIVGEDTVAAAGAEIVVRGLDRVAIYGRENGIETFELIGLRGQLPAETLAWLNAYEEGRAALRARQWQRAIDAFTRAIALCGGDAVAEIQIARARQYLASPPPPDWNGLVVMDAK